MRWILLLLGGIALLGGPAAAQPDSVSARFSAANAAYEQGQHTRAVEAYRQILDTGRASAALYYNLGNAYVRLGRLGQAIRYYEKARTLRPTDPRVEHNLEQARRTAGVYPGRLPPQGLAGLVQDWPPLILFAAGWLALGGAGVLAVRWTRPDGPSVPRHPLVWGGVAGGLLLVGVALGTAYVQSTQPRAVVVAEQAPLRTDPTPTAASDTTLPEGTLLGVEGEQAQWTEVRLANSTVGWVSARALGDV
jgi:tetratricopeptide (TPR) repeat protein